MVNNPISLVKSPLNEFPELIYIMGTGRNGTTILDIILSNSTGGSWIW